MHMVLRARAHTLTQVGQVAGLHVNFFGGASSGSGGIVVIVVVVDVDAIQKERTLVEVSF